MKKRVIITSGLTMLVAASLAVGGSYALFSSESKTNIAVTAGKVEVVANYVSESLSVYSMGNAMPALTFANGGTAAINPDGTELTLVNMTPGDKVTFDIAITNNSNVAIKYMVKLTTPTVDPLESALTVTAAGQDTWSEPVAPETAIDNVAVEVEMPENVGNEFMEKSVTYSIVVAATQGNAN